MNKVYTLIPFLSLFFIIQTINTIQASSCIYTLTLEDSAGDGWDGASIDVSINNVWPATNYTMTPANGNTFVINFAVNDGDQITLSYYNGANENQHAYQLTDSNGYIATAVGGQAINFDSSPPSNISYNVVVNCSPPATCVYTLVLTDTAGNGWDGASVDVAIEEAWPATNYKMYPSDGTSVSIDIPVNAGDLITLEYWNGAFESEHGLQLLDPFGNIVIDMNGVPIDYNGNIPAEIPISVYGTCGSSLPAPMCTYTLLLEDSQGNGWNGAYVEVAINGLAPTTTYSMNASHGYALAIDIEITEGDQVTITYYNNGWENQHSFEFLDPFGNIALDVNNVPIDYNGSPPSGTSNTTIVSCNNDGACVYILILKDAVGNSWDGASIDVAINGQAATNYTMDNTDGTIIYIPIYINSGDQIALTYNDGSLDHQHAFELHDPFGNIVVDTNGNPINYHTSPPETTSIVNASCEPPLSCTYTLLLEDSAPNGWDGASIQVGINNVEPATSYTMVMNDGPSLSIDIEINDGDLIEIVYWNGAFENEHSFELQDATGNIVIDNNGDPIDYNGSPPSGTLLGANAACDPLGLLCPMVLYVNQNTIANGNYSAQNTILCTSTLPSGGQANFDAGLEIILNAGFEVELGGVFEAQINSCQ